MTADPAALKSLLCRHIDARRDDVVALLQDFLRIRSVNPPGDTREAADFVRGILDRFGLEHRTVGAREDMPNILSCWHAPVVGRHLVLNGHMDVFPVSDDRLWAAEIEGDRIVARGASDMKTGTLASILTYGLLYPYRDRLFGKMTLTVVSDEQSGGRYGTKFLFENHEEAISGDCCLNGEPSGLGNLRFLEKGTLRFSLTAKGPGGHGGYPHRANNPIQQIVAATQALYDRYHLKRAEMPEELVAVLREPASIAAADALLGRGAADNALRITVNAGLIQGGRKATQIPTEAVVHIDIRVPYGPDLDRVRGELPALAAEFDCALVINEDHSYPASGTEPDGEMGLILQANTRALLGVDAPPVCSLGGTDTRYWRWRGIPAFIIGPSPLSMGTDDEHVIIDEAIAVLKLQVMCAVDYLSVPG